MTTEPGYQRAHGRGIAQADRGSTAQVIDKQYNFQYVARQPFEKIDPLVASSHFSSLPVDAVPGWSPLPEGSFMPWSLSPTFVGRDVDLKALAAIVKGGETAAIGQVAAATGLGGIGKTQLASAFAHAYGQYFLGGVYWLSFADPASVESEIALCGQAMFPEAGFSQLPIDEQVRLVWRAWQSPLPRLLVFDNCEDEDLLATWRPSSGGSRVLVTSRRQGWGATLGVQGLALGVLSRGESIELLRKHRPDVAADDPALDAIAEELGDLPLALHLAGSFLERYRYSALGEPSAYLVDLRRADLLDHRSMRSGGYSPTGHELHVAKTFALSLDQLDGRDNMDALALEFLSRGACFAPGQPIQRELLLATLDYDNDSDPFLGEDALTRLLALGLLVEEDDGSLVLHRLLVQFAQRELDDQSEEAATRVEWKVHEEALSHVKLELPSPLRSWESHLTHIASEAAKRRSVAAVYLLEVLGQHNRILARYASAQAALERALELRQSEMRSSGLDIANLYNSLGRVQHAQGHYNTACGKFERALTILKAEDQQYEFHIGSSLTNYGLLLRDMGKVQKAKALFEQALEMFNRSTIDSRREIANTKNNLGQALEDLGENEAAQHCFEQSIRIGEDVCGANHPAVATFINNLGHQLFIQEKVDEAEKCFRKALKIDKKAFGADHPTVAIDLNNLAGIHSHRGEFIQALDCHHAALDIDKAILPPDHPNFIERHNNIGYCLMNLDSIQEALCAFGNALKIYHRRDHRDKMKLAAILSNLGLAKLQGGSVGSAKTELQQALEIYESAEINDQSKAIGVAIKLSETLCILGDSDSAEELLFRISQKPLTSKVSADESLVILTRLAELQARRNSRAAENTYERASRFIENLEQSKVKLERHLFLSFGEFLIGQERFREAKGVLTALIKKIEEHFGDTDQELAIPLSDLSGALIGLKDWSGAEFATRRSLAIKAHAFGINHREYAASLSNLGLIFKSKEDYFSAKREQKRAVKILKCIRPRDPEALAIAEYNLANTLVELNDLASAKLYYKSAARNFEEILDPSHERVQIVKRDLKLLKALKSMGKSDLASKS